MILETLQAGKAHTIDRLPSHAELCNISMTGGTVYRNEYSYTHMRNSRDVQTYILPHYAADLKRSRLAVAELTSLDLPIVGWTYSRMARQIGDWIGIHDLPADAPRGLIERWHYQQVIPCTIKNCAMFDLTAAYFSLASRAPSLLCSVDLGRDSTTWLRMPGHSEARWEECKIALLPLKRLRLAVIGVSMTGYSKHADARAEYYCRGEIRIMASRAPTCFQTLALWTVRAAYEVTQIQARESRAYYANADCIASDIASASYWSDLGLPYACKGKGVLDVNGVGNYKIGGRETKPYASFGSHSLNPCAPYLYARPNYHLSIFQ